MRGRLTESGAWGRIRRVQAALWVACATVLLLTAPATGDEPGRTIEPRSMAAHHEPLREYRAFRRMHARSERLDQEGWLDAWTELDARGFRYRVVSERGSESVRNRVLKAVLRREQELAIEGNARAALTEQNYVFTESAEGADGFRYILMKPKRKDVTLVDGQMVLTRDGGELVRIEGRLARNPSFWTSAVHVVRHFANVNGTRVPVALESVAKIRLAGPSTLRVAYEYESVNGRAVTPAVRRQLALRTTP